MPDAQSLLPLAFAHRMVRDLATNNVLRGSWAEQLVAHFLDIDEHELPPNWTYYDMIDDSGREISVKHSTGKSPKFAVERSLWAWDNRLRAARPETEGWYGGTGEPQHWCHAYVFAWLPTDSSQLPLDDVLDPDAWRFAALSRANMYRQVAPIAAKTIGLSNLQRLTTFVPGADLRAVIDAFSSDLESPVIDVPARVRKPYTAGAAGPVVEVSEPHPDDP